MKKSFLIIFAGGLLLFSHLSAQVSWQKLEGPFGGVINPLAVDQNNQLYAVFNQTLSISTDNGLTWAPIFQNAYTFKFGLNSRLYAESLGRKIYVSDDHGATWVGLPLTINGLRLERLAIAQDGTLYFAADDRLYMSINGGQEWTILSTQFNGHASCVLVGTQNDLFVYGNNQLFIKKSTDADFSLLLNAENTIRTVFQNKNGDIFISVGAETGSVFKSTNRGVSWSPTSLPFVQSFYESKNGLLFGAGSANGYIVSSRSFISSTNGESWNSVDVGSPIFSFAVNSVGDIFVASDGLFVSKNSGSTYNLISPNNSNVIHILNPSHSQLFCVTGINEKYAHFWTSQNDGATWTGIDKKTVFNKPVSYIDAKMVGTDRLWLLLGYSANNDTVVSSSSIYESRDVGRTWKKIRDFDRPGDFDVDKTRNTIYFWISGQKYFYRTDDFGSAWIPMSLPFEAGELLAASNGLVFGYSKADKSTIRRLYTSYDKGDKWHYTDVPYNDVGKAQLAIDRFGHIYKITSIPQNDATFTLSSLLRSSDYGETFVNITPDSGSALQNSKSLFCAMADYNGVVYLTGSHFISVSRNNGSAWREIFKSDAQNTIVHCLQTNNGVDLYVGTFSNGIMKTTNKAVAFAPQLIGGLEVPISLSFGVNWIDYDSDGYDDIFLVNDGPNLLFKNNRDGTFQRITTGSIVTDNEPSRSASWADYNNDGYLDCFVANGVKDVYNSLYKNNGDGTFRRITEGNIVEDYGDYRSSAWADMDNDGDLDLYVTEVSEEYPNILYINDGTNHFTKSTDIVIGSKAGQTYNCGWCDFDNDGDVDIYLANQGADNLFEQVRPGEFALVGTSRIETNMGSAVSCSWGDFNNDGFMDLFVVNYDIPNCLYRNDGDGSFTKITAPGIGSDNKISKGSAWADYDNDGDIDLFVANRDSYLFYTNDGLGNFSKAEMNEFTYHGGNALSVAWGDKENDGDLDLVIASYDQQSLVYNNMAAHNNWIKIRCTGNTSTNRSALGTKIRIVTTIDNKRYQQIRHISASSGHAGQNSLVQHFGLGAATKVDSIIVRWPTGKKQILLDKQANQRITVVESASDFVEAKNLAVPKNYSLGQNYPNPFNPTTTIEYLIPENTFVNLSIFDATGQHVKTLVQEMKQTGAHTIQWHGENEQGASVASGLYLYKILTKNYEKTGKMTLLR